MSDGSKIEWTDATWNPTRGCDKVSPGCKHCYAETFAERWRGIKGHPFEHGFDLRLVPEALSKPLHWKKSRKIFVNSMSDLFHEEIPNEYIAAVFGVMAACPQHTFQILTKRAERMPEWFSWAEQERTFEGAVIMTAAEVCRREASNRLRVDVAFPMVKNARWPLPNVHLGVSAENQQTADERIPYLLRTPAAVRWVSAEPLLGPLRVDDIGDGAGAGGCLKPLVGLHWVPTERGMELQCGKGPKLDWVVVGSESGPGARAMDIAWARSIVDQCVTASVPVFTKQIANTQDRKGGDPQFWPAGKWPREFPVITP